MKHILSIACLVLQLLATSTSAHTLRTAAQESPPKFFKHSDGGMTVAMNLYKLMRKRGRLMLQSEVEIVSSLKEQKMESNFRILPARFNESGRYVAFSRNVPAQAIAKVQLALDKLNHSGELELILSRYR